MSDRRSIGYVVEIDGSTLLINLLEEARGHVAGHRDGLSTVEQPGDLIGVEGGAETIVLRIQTVAFAEPKEVHTGRSAIRSSSSEPLRQLKGRVIGYLSRGTKALTFFPQDWRLPVLGASAFPLADKETLATISGKGESGAQVPLGTDARNAAIEVRVGINDLLGRHMAVLGATGQGKTHFVAALLQHIAQDAKYPRIIVFDVNGEYPPAFATWGDRVKRTMLGSISDADKAAGVCGLRIPYYALGRHGLARLLLPSERTQMPALRFAVEHLLYIEADASGARICGHPNNTLYDDCRTDDAQIAFTQLEAIRKRSGPKASRWPHMRGLSALAAESYSLKMSRVGNQSIPQRDAFSYGHIHSLINRIRSLIDDEQFTEVVDITGGTGVSAAFSMQAESASLVNNVFGTAMHDSSSWMIHILDLSRLTQDLMPFVLGSLLELYAAELFRRGPSRTHPTMLVLEEAHHYLRQLPGDADIGQHSLAYERLAKEGRKFGLSLMVSTQRPSEVSSTVLAQCGTWAVFRLSNESDQKAVGAAAEAAGVNVTRQLSGLGRGEAIVFGAALPVPTRVSMIRPNPEPDSKDPPFEAAWGYRVEID
jgi:hypothetical protein